uniref:Uncharacterized protein LOC123617187 n=1 Tax=Camelus bactrianus TaxID=9837 RepID=A0A9W3G6Y1_CAMBA|nr:uncharacterized protein LOC123617187 [Camelus bactrianus]
MCPHQLARGPPVPSTGAALAGPAPWLLAQAPATLLLPMLPWDALLQGRNGKKRRKKQGFPSSRSEALGGSPGDKSQLPTAWSGSASLFIGQKQRDPAQSSPRGSVGPRTDGGPPLLTGLTPSRVSCGSSHPRASTEARGGDRRAREWAATTRHRGSKVATVTSHLHSHFTGQNQLPGDVCFKRTEGCQPRICDYRYLGNSHNICHHEMTLCFPNITIHRLPEARPRRD